MQINFTKNNLNKLELVFAELSYEIRYEKGHFQSGYCIVADKRIILISKFFNTQARIESLIEILSEINIEESTLSLGSKKFFGNITKMAA